MMSASLLLDRSLLTLGIRRRQTEIQSSTLNSGVFSLLFETRSCKSESHFSECTNSQIELEPLRF